MEFRAALTSAADVGKALAELCEPIAGFNPDLVILLITPAYEADYREFISAVRDSTNTRVLIGGTCAGVIGPGREIESGAGAALWAAKLPGVRIFPYVLDQNDFITMRTAEAWQDRLGVAPDDIPTFINLPDPFSVQFGICLRIMDEVYPGSTTVGGVISGAQAPGRNRLFVNDQVLRQGLVGVSLAGDYRISTIVSQGCRPIGPPYVITKADSNVILELGGRNAYNVLRELHDKCSPQDQALIRNGLHVGRAVDEHLEEFGPGDFLIRNVAGVVEQKGVAVTDYVRPGQTVRFHVRDAESADAEMRELIQSRLRMMPTSPRGGLLFSCNGRGTNMFPEPNHDIALINELMPDCPVAGFFAAGEIGPVGGKTFVHGLTGSLMLFHEPGAASETE
jgi:small ligand-binding sensory domain FIST